MSDDRMTKARAAIFDVFLPTVHALIFHPEDLEVTLQEKTGVHAGWSIEMRSHLADYGRIVGTKGRTFNALMTLGACIGQRHGIHVILRGLMKPTVGEPEKVIFDPNCNWPGGRPQFATVVEKIAGYIFRGTPPIMVIADTPTLVTEVAVHISTGERIDVLESRITAATTLVDAIGRRYGRTMELDVIQDLDPIVDQPKAAHGRYTKEIPR